MGFDPREIIELLSLIKPDQRQSNQMKTIKKLEIEKVNLHETVSDILSDNLHVLTEIPATVINDANGELFTNRIMIHEVFSNLIDNSVRHRCEDRHLLMRISAREDRDCWRFAVKDNGPGILKELQEDLRKAFKLVKAGNLHPPFDRGLFRVAAAVFQLDGQLRFVSLPGNGTSFFVVIPKSRLEIQPVD